MIAETLKRTQAILQQLQDQINRGIPIIGAGAGTGISAKFEEAGGVDLIVLYNSGRFRMAGRGSLAGLLPYADANAIVLDMANEVLPVSVLSTATNQIDYLDSQILNEHTLVICKFFTFLLLPSKTALTLKTSSKERKS